MNIKLSVNLESTLTSLTEKWARRRAAPSSAGQTNSVGVGEAASGTGRLYARSVKFAASHGTATPYEFQNF